MLHEFHYIELHNFYMRYVFMRYAFVWTFFALLDTWNNLVDYFLNKFNMALNEDCFFLFFIKLLVPSINYLIFDFFSFCIYERRISMFYDVNTSIKDQLHTPASIRAPLQPYAQIFLCGRTLKYCWHRHRRQNLSPTW